MTVRYGNTSPNQSNIISVEATNKCNRKHNDLYLFKDGSIYKFIFSNSNAMIIENGVINLQILARRGDELSELPSINCDYYDCIVVNNTVIYQKLQINEVGEIDEVDNHPYTQPELPTPQNKLLLFFNKIKLLLHNLIR